jgi:molybdopterin-binding protein
MRAFCHAQWSVALAVASVVAFATTAHADIRISSKPTKNIICSTPNGGICVAVADDAILNSTVLANMLAASDVKITTGQRAIAIQVTAALTWTSAKHLTIDSGKDVIIRAPVVVAGPGGLSIATGNGGGLSFPGKGCIKFWEISSQLSINGNAYVLASSLGMLAGDIGSNSSGNFALANDYDAKPDGTHFASPIQEQLKGRFEGLGNTISHVKVRDFSNFWVGLFSTLGYLSEVENLHIVDISIRAEGRADANGGGLAGGSTAIVRNVTTSGNVQGGAAGGLIGSGGQGGLITNSSSSATVTGSVAGGLVAVDSGTIVNSHASGAVSGPHSSWLGGFVGVALADVIEQSFATGTVVAGNRSYAGGFAGKLDGGTLKASFASGLVSAGTNASAGGFVGFVCACQTVPNIEDSYALGSVAGGSPASIGGFAGATQVSGLVAINASYSIGIVSGGDYRGGFMGFDSSGDLQNTDWDLDTGGISDPSQGAGNIANDPGITGLTDVQLKSELPAGFLPNVWGQSPNINNGYPYLLANPPPQ